MKKINLTLLVSIISMWSTIFVFGQSKTESPYFVIKNSKQGLMPLESNKAEINISGIIADVTLSQTFKNNSNDILEAVYVFPGSAQSAIYDMEMQIGDRIIKAELQEKQAALKTYNDAKKAGKRTSLLEQHRPNVFQMNVANILPGEKIHIRLKYTEKIIPISGNYQFALPTVVGPRYNNQHESQSNSFENMPYLSNGKSPDYSFEIDVFLQAGQNIKSISSHTHSINIKKFNERIAHVSIDDTELYAGNKDFVLTYRLSDANINTGLLLYEHQDENFFLATIQPPNYIADYQTPAKEYIFIVDVSGSMFGFPLEVSKKLMNGLLTGLKPTDKFNVMLFAGTSYMFSDTSLDATQKNIEMVLDNMENQQGSGSTELLPALQKAIQLPRAYEGLSRSLVVITDGYITVEKEAFELIQNNLNKANVFAFGIGSGVNRFLIEGLANIGQGLPFFVENEEVACDVSEQFKNYISSPSLTDISIRYENFEAYDIEPKSIPDLLGERPINIIGKWKGNNSGKIIIDGFFAGYKYQQVINIGEYTPDSKNKALRSLWAREKIRLLDDYRKILYDESHKESLTNLSLQYNLLSAYTSFVAVDYEKAQDGDQLVKTVKQSLPLPVGVSNYAIGAEMEVKKVKKSPNSNSSYWKIKSPIGISNATIGDEIRMKFIMNLQALKHSLKDAITKDFSITLKFNEKGELEKIICPDNLLHHSDALAKEILSWDFSTIAVDPNSEIIIPVGIEVK